MVATNADVFAPGRIGIQQIAAFAPGASALKQNQQLTDTVSRLVEDGFTPEAKEIASKVLLQLNNTLATQNKAKAEAAESGGGGGVLATPAAGHIMLSYNWGHQEVIKRLNLSLKARGYNIWIDIEKMQGSTVEAMSAAVEDSTVICYGISKAYKESANCRLEAQYAYQCKKDMVPLMMEDGYQASGWLGMLLGVRLWYGFYGSVLASDSAFEGRVNDLCRELGTATATAHQTLAVGGKEAAPAPAAEPEQQAVVHVAPPPRTPAPQQQDEYAYSPSVAHHEQQVAGTASGALGLVQRLLDQQRDTLTAQREYDDRKASEWRQESRTERQRVDELLTARDQAHAAAMSQKDAQLERLLREAQESHRAAMEKKDEVPPTSTAAACM